MPPQLMGVSISGSLRRRALRPWDLTGRLMFAARRPAPADSVCGTRLSEFGLEPLHRFTKKGDPVPPQLMGVSISGSLRARRALRPWDLTGRLMFAARWPAARICRSAGRVVLLPHVAWTVLCQIVEHSSIVAGGFNC